MNGQKIQIDDAPLNRFHLRITALTFGSNFSDGYALGIISMALAEMNINANWQSWIGSSALIGLFLGSWLLGGLSDRIGRQKIFLLNFLLVSLASFLQLFVPGLHDLWILFALRILIGFGLGGDYAVGSTLLAEFAPKKYRGILLSSLNVLWTVGYTLATVVGYYMTNSGPDSWKWMLATGTIPAVIVLILRLGTPESPRWLISQGRVEEAKAVVKKYVGQNIEIDDMITSAEETSFHFRDLFKRHLIGRTVFGSLFYIAIVLPYFAIYTFLPTILSDLGFKETFLIDTLLNIFLLLGAVAGLWFTQKMTRRAFTIYSFVVLTVSLFLVQALPSNLHTEIFVAFAIFTFIMSAVSNLTLVYPAELFPTHVRGTGVGFVTAMSRIGAVVGTYFLPQLPLATSMYSMVGVLLVFGICASIFLAPETGRKSLHEASNPLAQSPGNIPLHEANDAM